MYKWAAILLFGFGMNLSVAANKSSLEQVAIHAEKAAFESASGQYYEYGGVIILRDGVLTFTIPITNLNDRHVHIIPNPFMGKDDVLKGTFHTHPCRLETLFSQYFSVLDMNLTYDYNVPAFILNECTGNVQEFDPLKDNPKVHGEYVPGFPKMVYLTSGRIVGNIGERGVNLDAIIETK